MVIITGTVPVAVMPKSSFLTVDGLQGQMQWAEFKFVQATQLTSELKVHFGRGSQGTTGRKDGHETERSGPSRRTARRVKYFEVPSVRNPTKAENCILASRTIERRGKSNDAKKKNNNKTVKIRSQNAETNSRGNKFQKRMRSKCFEVNWSTVHSTATNALCIEWISKMNCTLWRHASDDTMTWWGMRH